MHVVFRHDRDVVSENPGGGVDPTRVARWARRQGVLSFGYLFFARAKRRFFNSRMAGQSSSLPVGERKLLILLWLLPLLGFVLLAFA